MAWGTHLHRHGELGRPEVTLRRRCQRAANQQRVASRQRQSRGERGGERLHQAWGGSLVAAEARWRSEKMLALSQKPRDRTLGSPVGGFKLVVLLRGSD